MNNISYQRTKTTAHMVQEEAYDAEETEENQPFDQCMVLRNDIRGLLNVQTLIINNRRQYIYDISRLQSVAFFCEQGPLKFEIVRNLIDGLTDIQTETERYLLKEEKLVYNPEYVFMDFQGTVKCCYDLCSNTENRGSMQEMIAYLLLKIDSKDNELVSYIYKLYEDSLKKEFSLRHWVDEYYENKSRHKMEEEELSAIEKDYSTDAIQREENWMSGGDYEIDNENCSKEKIEEDEIDIPREGFWEKLKKRFHPFIRHASRKNEKPEEESYFYIPEEEVVPAVQETVFFTSQKGAAEAFLQPMQFGDMPIHLVGKNQIIGKENYADIILTDPTVSRMHARITYKEEVYYLEDLNSTNGTLVNGKLLQLKQAVALKEGDLLSFGQAAYTFCKG